MLTIACVKWGDKYGPNYVTKLHSMCGRHFPEHEFVCFTEAPVDGIVCEALPSSLPGWWAKVGLFQPGLFAGDVIYLDLDVVITRDCWDLVRLLDEDRTRLWALDDFSYSVVNPRRGLGPEQRRLLGGDGTINSSVMLWNPAKSGVSKIWNDFTVEKMDEVHGDQNWITQCLWPEINLIPKGWAESYKYNNHQPGPITVFHGNPKPPDVRDPWVRDHWR